MAGVTYDTFERYQQKGLDARRAGQWDSARIYLLEAARAMLELSKQAQGEELAEGRRQISARLLELARDCEKAKSENRKRPGVGRKGGGTGGGGGGGQEKSSDGENEPSADQWVVKEKPDITFANVAGLEDVKEDIRLKMVYPFQHPELAKKFGIRGGGGVLLYGPPGTGKTMLAKATAGELEATFFKVSPAEMLSKWVGEAEQNIKKLFDAAFQEKRAVIFIDEIEALVPARRDEGSSVMQRVVPQILQGMEGFDQKKDQRAVLFMGATNVPWQLDPAVLRPGRFDEKVYIPLPDLAARRKMLDIYLSKRPLEENMDLDALANKLDGFSGADIKYVCDRSATIPFLRSVATGTEGPITDEIVAEVIAATPRSVNKEMLDRFEKWAAESGS
ncbi:MAG TPA: ATP-binding protein [Tepidisphaeraceae bacterium]|nr:ATP-binding protein [Tepidisphaeraceae bacterium]